MNNCITVIIETLHKASNNKGYVTISEAHKVKEFQRTISIQMRESEMIIIAITQGHGMED